MSVIEDLDCLGAYVLAYHDFPGSRPSNLFEVTLVSTRCWYWMGRTTLGSPHYRKASELAFVCRIPSHYFHTLPAGHRMAALACMSRSHLLTILDFAAQRASHVLSSCMNCCCDLRKSDSINSAASQHAASLRFSARIVLKTEHKSAAGYRRWVVTSRGRSLSRCGRGCYRQEC